MTTKSLPLNCEGGRRGRGAHVRHCNTVICNREANKRTHILTTSEMLLVQEGGGGGGLFETPPSSQCNI